MLEIPMSLRDEMKYLKPNNIYVGIKRMSHLPLPENNLIRGYLFSNIPRILNIGFNDKWIYGVKRQNHPADVVPSIVHKDDLLIQAHAVGYDARYYFHIPHEHIDDPDPMCDMSIVTNWGSIYKENNRFSDNMINFKKWSLDNLEMVIKNLKK